MYIGIKKKMMSFQKNLDELLLKINNLNILKKDSVIILHRHKKEKEIFPSNFKIIEKKQYGISKIVFLTVLN